MAVNVIEGVPIVDVSKPTDPSVLRRIDRACREWGFFQIVGHGIEKDAFDALQRETRGFFDLPLEAKRRVVRSAENPWGFYDRELTKNARDCKQIFDCGLEDDPKQPTPWPPERPGFRPAVRGFSDACARVAFQLLAAISTNLGMPADHLARAFRPRHTSFLRLNYYPPRPSPARPSGLRIPEHGHFGVHHHTDAGALTLLIQDDVAGLEVFREGCWHLVEPRRGAIVVNIGDIVQVWSNDRYHAALHRVRASTDRARYSAPYFFNPDYETLYAPLPTTIDASRGPRYSPICWGEFRSLRSAGDYRDQGEEVQIDHYRLDRERSKRDSTRENPYGIH